MIFFQHSRAREVRPRPPFLHYARSVVSGPQADARSHPVSESSKTDIVEYAFRVPEEKGYG